MGLFGFLLKALIISLKKTKEKVNEAFGNEQSEKVILLLFVRGFR